MTNVAEQIAALPMRLDKNGALAILMVTSRDSGRRVMPKGWAMEDKTPWDAAEIEALEEAGAVGQVASRRIGEYRCEKTGDDGAITVCPVQIYPLLVHTLKRDWKERGERRRRWFSARAAANSVDEPVSGSASASIGHETAHPGDVVGPAEGVKTGGLDNAR